MSDAALRELEREVLGRPADVDLRRRHVALLRRAGEDERAVAALDLAWRLGADELWPELEAELAARRRQVGPITLCYVPGGPFVMGADDQDEDAAPAHLVHLSPFYVAAGPLTLGALRGSGVSVWYGEEWLSRVDERYRQEILAQDHVVTHDEAMRGVEHLARGAFDVGLAGRWALISEAQWERVFRAGHWRPDGASPYGARACGAEWTQDRYDPAAYAGGARRDPTGPEAGDLRVVRGAATNLPAPLFATFREAASPGGSFDVGKGTTSRWVRHEPGVFARPVFVPQAPA
ncbi:MAG: formylglycine-generating enzyme family protein [Planctomycetes bacterium]|nr:formylglycine-generating enzyme family protein [Planctomycetota bacterium]